MNSFKQWNWGQTLEGLCISLCSAAITEFLRPNDNAQKFTWLIVLETGNPKIQETYLVRSFLLFPQGGR